MQAIVAGAVVAFVAVLATAAAAAAGSSPEASLGVPGQLRCRLLEASP